MGRLAVLDEHLWTLQFGLFSLRPIREEDGAAVGRWILRQRPVDAIIRIGVEAAALFAGQVIAENFGHHVVAVLRLPHIGVLDPHIRMPLELERECISPRGGGYSDCASSCRPNIPDPAAEARLSQIYRGLPLDRRRPARPPSWSPNCACRHSCASARQTCSSGRHPKNKLDR